MSRIYYLLVTQTNALDTWGRELSGLFHYDVENYGAFLVGSALKRADYKDVDIRQILSDEDWNRLFETVDIGYFNHAISLWGQQVTGLPIDYQVQSINSIDNKGTKQPIGMTEKYINSLNKE